MDLFNITEKLCEEKSYIELLHGYCTYASDFSDEILNASILTEKILELHKQLMDYIENSY